jgi:hypothetical protein
MSLDPLGSLLAAVVVLLVGTVLNRRVSVLSRSSSMAKSRSTMSSFDQGSSGCASPTPTPSPRLRSSWPSTSCTTTAAT